MSVHIVRIFRKCLLLTASLPTSEPSQLQQLAALRLIQDLLADHNLSNWLPTSPPAAIHLYEGSDVVFSSQALKALAHLLTRKSSQECLPGKTRALLASTWNSDTRADLTDDEKGGQKSLFLSWIAGLLNSKKVCSHVCHQDHQTCWRERTSQTSFPWPSVALTVRFMSATKGNGNSTRGVAPGTQSTVCIALTGR